MLKKLSISLLAIAIVLPATAAIEYNLGNYDFNLSGYGTAGGFVSDKTSGGSIFLNDWSVRGQGTYSFDGSYKLGAVYSLDELAVYQKEYINEFYGFFQGDDIGRVEFGITNSVAVKLSLGIPDVGGLRLNNTPIIYRKMEPDNPYISGLSLNNAKYSTRINYVLPKVGNNQFGFSVSNGDNSNFELDAAWKYKNSNGKLKSAYSLAASYLDAPTDMQVDVFSPKISADWRGQIAASTNLQYNSWMVGATATLIYDKNAVGTTPGDGLTLGAGVSYDFLNYSASLSYILSDTSIWHENGYVYNTTVLSLRYKYDKNWDIWMSGGYSVENPYVSGGLRLKF